MLNAQEDVITHVRMSIELMTYVLQMSKLQVATLKELRRLLRSSNRDATQGCVFEK
jgi:hypothetical protein